MTSNNEILSEVRMNHRLVSTAVDVIIFQKTTEITNFAHFP